MQFPRSELWQKLQVKITFCQSQNMEVRFRDEVHNSNEI